MRAAVLKAPETTLSLEERETPEPGAGEVLVRVTACGMCFSEVNLVHGHYPFARYPTVPGHEITGVVERLGPGVTWPEPGTPVGAQFLHSSCGHCSACARGEPILCPGKKVTGIATDGGYAEYFLAREGFVSPLPDGLDPVAAAPLMCAGVTAFNGLRRAGARPGQRVAVVGIGGVGGMVVRLAVAMGTRVAALARSRDSEGQARGMGAELFVATEEQDPAEALKAWGGGADLVVNAAPSTDAALAAFGGLAPDGTLLLLGYGPEPLAVPTQPLIMNRLRVMGSPSGSPHDLRDALGFAAAHGILPTVTPIALDDAPGVLTAMADGTSRGRSVIVYG
ncbi:alcohol dehydrogenase catalytic domain-containing protein [Streptomyces sp. HU2014]|uniref:alcohol dehydrogenase catalytic domain-containing protein n=1 Tax=Streptomyces sp. HU2014 TaxID=2939414 RepID=UPI00200C2C43|nr:alcohol dehydrogenase catalytic domain-containing protein [Streptomyces sp. HU2014]UQI46663.1 alcohol dehydrogenase catalytic domain-containing protein [Streptomyces sp. HU2014]